MHARTAAHIPDHETAREHAHAHKHTRMHTRARTNTNTRTRARAPLPSAHLKQRDRCGFDEDRHEGYFEPQAAPRTRQSNAKLSAGAVGGAQYCCALLRCAADALLHRSPLQRCNVHRCSGAGWLHRSAVGLISRRIAMSASISISSCMHHAPCCMRHESRVPRKCADAGVRAPRVRAVSAARAARGTPGNGTGYRRRLTGSKQGARTM